MAEKLTQGISSLNPFGGKPKPSKKIDEEDQGEEIAYDPHGARAGHVSKSDLVISNALKSYLVEKKLLSERDAGVDKDVISEGLRALINRPHIHVPAELTDRRHPLPEYFISSSHNTYLLAHQLFGESCATGYQTALRNGSRCVEIDAWDSDNPEEPKVTHGYTLVSHISFRLVCETIRDVFDDEVAAAAAKPGHKPAPILLSLENHCGAKGQVRLAQIMREVLQDRLLSKAIRDEGTREEQQTGEHVYLDELGAKIAVIVEYHFPGEAESSDTDSSDESDDEKEKAARQEYKNKKKQAAAAVIVPELADLGVYAQSVKPVDNSWYEPGVLANSPHHHLINVSETGLLSHLPKHTLPIAVHNSQHLMRVFPKGTRIGSGNLKPTTFWGLGAQICALNGQSFGTSNQLNDALFATTDGYVLKPRALRSGGNGQLSTGRKKKLRLHVAGASSIPLKEESERDSFKPYLTCTLYHPSDLTDEPPKRKTSPYKPHKLGFLHRGENPPATDPIWDEVLEWEYAESELVFLRMLIKNDISFARNPMYTTLAIRLDYVVPDWTFVRMLDLKGRETACTVLVRFEITDAE